MDDAEDRKFNVLFRLLKLLTKKWYLLLVSTISVIAYANIVSLGPLIVRYAIDLGISANDIPTTIKYSLILIGITALGALAWFVTRYSTALLSQELVHELRVKAFSSILNQSLDFFDRVPAGQLISRITNDTDRLARTLSWQVRNIVNLSFTAGLSLYYMFTMNFELSLIVLAAMTLMAILNIKYATSIRPIYDRIRNQLGVLASIATSNLNGIRTVKALTLESFEKLKFMRENELFNNLNLVATKIRALYGNAPHLILGITMALIIYYGGISVSSGYLSIGELTAFITYLSILMWPMRALGFTISAFQRALAAAQRIFEIIDSKPTIHNPPATKKLNDIKGEIIFDNVVFHYVEGKPVLKGVSLKVRPGEKVLILGPPGSGKSTILKLLMRFYNPVEGKILIDGHDIRELDIKTLRDQVALVPQEPFIFSSTIKENIAIGNPNASFDDIIKAARIANIHDFIESLPNSYDTVVGERGLTLSGGQRQRIAIARALLKNPKILLLDDPVSNLDTETEKNLIKDLESVLKGRTVIIVSQRVSLARLADRIIVLDQGKIIEEGTHEELISRKGPYYRLYVISMKGADHEHAGSKYEHVR